MVQWLGLSTFTAVARVQALVGEVISCKRRGMAKKINKALKILVQFISKSVLPMLSSRSFIVSCLF